MKAALIVVAAGMFSCAVMQGAERTFDDIVQAISDEFHTRPLHIPFLGLLNFAAFTTHPAGAKHIDLAVFENLPGKEGSIRRLSEAIRSAKRGWHPFVEVHGHAESVLVYIAEDGNDCKLLVASMEPGEVTVVELKLNPEALQVWLREPEKSAARRQRWLE
jgi:hypothetical protein